MYRFAVFSYCSITKGFAFGFQSRFDNDWVLFGVFCWNMPRVVDFITAWTEICMNYSVVNLLCRHLIFSKVSLSGILVCSLDMLNIFSYRFLKSRLISFSIAMQPYFLPFCVFQSSSPEKCDGISL